MSGRWLMITCREAHVLLSHRQDRRLGPMEQVRLRLHLWLCDWCARIGRQFRFLSQATRRLDL